jgi:hypothetical protein
MRALIEGCAGVTGSEDMVSELPLIEVTGPELPDAAVERHQEIAALFASTLVPYCTDFAMSKRVETSAEKLLAILDDEGFRTVDVSGAYTLGTTARSCSLFPVDAGLIEAFLDRIGDARRLVEVIKVRLFYTFEQGEFSLRIVPMVLTDALPVAGMVSWLEKIGIDLPEQRKTDDDVLQAGATIASMVLSAALLEVVREYMSPVHQVDFPLDQDFLKLTAGSFAELVQGIDAGSLGVLAEGVQEPNRQLTDPFVWPGNEKSNGARHSRLGSDDVIKPVLDRIHAIDGESGLSISEVAREVKSSPAAASCALDPLNDIGAVASEWKRTGDFIKRIVRAAESSPRYKEYPKGRKGGRLAILARRAEVPEVPSQ